MRPNKRGFTLIELLVVVFITAVMGGVVIKCSERLCGCRTPLQIIRRN
ncbi:type II secretion system protein [Marinomonas gallaica]